MNASLSECIWIPFSRDDAVVSGLKFDFSNSDIEVSDADGVVVDIGNWEVQAGQFIFSSFSTILSHYNGTWTIIENRDVFFELEKGEAMINFERNCQ